MAAIFLPATDFIEANEVSAVGVELMAKKYSAEDIARIVNAIFLELNFLPPSNAGHLS